MVVLAGGSGRRLGGQDKAALVVGGRTLLERVLTACGHAFPVIVGPEQQGGPVAAIESGLRRLSPDTSPSNAQGGDLVAVVAVDQPFLTRKSLDVLAEAASGFDGAIYADDNGNPQWLCGVWRVTALRAAVSASPSENAALRPILSGLRHNTIRSAAYPPPWLDCDTPEQLALCRRLAEASGDTAAGTSGG
ncbi:molybdenum cofactor guanylyltransferase [Longispora albida]|uniref:molybdenum cofactor guanylyltransferase n=1 Tax=Longispora albida TaxID=203523 RepID=UPI00035D2510|nr:molybdenum cofactor guanylyltransferase [Longispora albida]